MSVDHFSHLPVRQWLFLQKLVHDLRIAEEVAAKSSHFKDRRRWLDVITDFKNDIARASKEGWRP